VIGASLSGIDALCELVSKLPAGFPAAIFIAQHVRHIAQACCRTCTGRLGRFPLFIPKMRRRSKLG
jgi:two-component system, chemotaxis family, protein-glutamate methylesterase/glutaminase